MNIRRFLILAATHGIALAIGFAIGIYTLPILIAPSSPTSAELATVAAEATFSGEFRRELTDSDAFHWGEGTVSVAPRVISHSGKLAPGPDYKLYLSPQFVETEADFNKLKPSMALIGDVRTFDGFVVPVPSGIDPSEYNSVIVWCESFGEFITAAQFQ